MSIEGKQRTGSEDMNSKQAANFLSSIGHSELSLHKAEGVWYLIGGSDEAYKGDVERCLHVVRLEDVTEDCLRWKVEELVKRDPMDDFNYVGSPEHY